MPSEFSPLGIRLAVDAEAPGLRAAVADACRGWEGDVDDGARRLRLKLAVAPGLHGTGGAGIDVRGPCLRIEGRGVEAAADATSGSARCAVSGDYLSDARALREEVLDPLILFLLARTGRVPIHASGFMAGDMAVLLAGPSGTGKSCLALAAHEAGFALLSDDTVYLQREPRLRIWGVPRPIHLFPKDAPAGSGDMVRLRNGKLKHAVPVDGGMAAVAARRAALCMLSPGSRISLQPIGQDEAMRSRGKPEPGFDLLADDIEAAFEALTRNGAWRLTLSADPAEAVRFLGENLSRLGVITAP